MIRSFLYKNFQININLIKIYLPSIFYLQNAINLAVPLVSHGKIVACNTMTSQRPSTQEKKVNRKPNKNTNDSNFRNVRSYPMLFKLKISMKFSQKPSNTPGNLKQSNNLSKEKVANKCEKNDA